LSEHALAGLEAIEQSNTGALIQAANNLTEAYCGMP
jgi:hypothetical protein